MRSRTAQEQRDAKPWDTMRSPTPRGVVFGRLGERYIIKAEETDGHALVIGGVGSGKSSCIAIPTVRAWNERVFAIDIKGELFRHTRAYRPNIKVLNPFSPTAYGYDPYFALRHSDNPAQEAHAIALAIIPSPAQLDGNSFWIENAQNVLTAAILHFAGMGLTFVETVKELQEAPPNTLIVILATSTTPEARSYVMSFVGLADQTLSGIMAELTRHIVTFATDRSLISCFSRKRNITPADLERGFDIYVCIPERLLEQWRSFLALIVNQFMAYCERRDEASATPILFLLDEFPRLGKIPKSINGLATLRSKKITIVLLLQSLAQLDSIYGSDNRKNISDTCAYKAILGATDADTQEYFSRVVGTRKKAATVSTSYTPIGGVNRGRSYTVSDAEKRIIKPEEFATLRDIVMLTPHGWFRTEKSPYYLQ
jgi:type IV secretion system protein VirD4